MARQLRPQIAGGVFHVTARGNAKADIYRGDCDRRVFLGILGKAIGSCGWTCLAYCLMGNHYHLLLETPVPNLSKGMRQVNATYAQWFNRRHDRCGHLFQGRFSAVHVRHEAHMLELARYIALNPVRAGLCESPGDWPWSSFQATCGEVGPGFLAPDKLLEHFSVGPQSPREAYIEFVNDVDPHSTAASLY